MRFVFALPPRARIGGALRSGVRALRLRLGAGAACGARESSRRSARAVARRRRAGCKSARRSRQPCRRRAAGRADPFRAAPTSPIRRSADAFVPETRDVTFSERGLASWYGRKFHGKRTASGEVYDMYAMTAAHPTLPIPSYARVRNPANGREALVRINDRGPFVSGRIVDLSYAAAFKLDLLRGVAPVELERITFDEIRTGAWRSGGANRFAAASAATTPPSEANGRGATPPVAVDVPVQDVAFTAATTPVAPPPPDDARVTKHGSVSSLGPPIAGSAATPGPPTAGAATASSLASAVASADPRAAPRPRAGRGGARLLGPARCLPRARRRRELSPPHRRRRRGELARAAARDLRRRDRLSRPGGSVSESRRGRERGAARPRRARDRSRRRRAAMSASRRAGHAPRRTILFTGHRVDEPDRAGAALPGRAGDEGGAPHRRRARRDRRRRRTTSR